ncbi:MAG TPA: type II secretion system F family protein [Methylocella sp.]|nr:type II secretion system F family protein [Methylocella sp.]
MLLAGLAALALLLTGAVLVFSAFHMARRAREEMGRRLNLAAGVREARPAVDTVAGLLKDQTKKFDQELRRVLMKGMKRTWGVRSSSPKIFGIGAASAFAAWSLADRFFELPFLLSAVSTLCAGFFAPRIFLAREQSRAERQFVELFPDAVDTVARMVRAGLPITAAMRTIAVEGTPPVKDVFARVADQLKIGAPIEETLEASSEEIGLPDFRFFTVAVALQYSTGGNLTSTLESLSDIIRKRRAARLKAKAATGEIRFTAFTLGGIPIVTTGALLVIQPGYLTPLWTDPRGHFIIAMAGVCLLMAYLSMRAMMRGITNA